MRSPIPALRVASFALVVLTIISAACTEGKIVHIQFATSATQAVPPSAQQWSGSCKSADETNCPFDYPCWYAQAAATVVVQGEAEWTDCQIIVVRVDASFSPGVPTVAWSTSYLSRLALVVKAGGAMPLSLEGFTFHAECPLVLRSATESDELTGSAVINLVSGSSYKPEFVAESAVLRNASFTIQSRTNQFDIRVTLNGTTSFKRPGAYDGQLIQVAGYGAAGSCALCTANILIDQGVKLVNEFLSGPWYLVSTPSSADWAIPTINVILYNAELGDTDSPFQASALISSPRTVNLVFSRASAYLQYLPLISNPIPEGGTSATFEIKVQDSSNIISFYPATNPTAPLPRAVYGTPHRWPLTVTHSTIAGFIIENSILNFTTSEIENCAINASYPFHINGDVTLRVEPATLSFTRLGEAIFFDFNEIAVNMTIDSHLLLAAPFGYTDATHFRFGPHVMFGISAETSTGCQITANALLSWSGSSAQIDTYCSFSASTSSGISIYPGIETPGTLKGIGDAASLELSSTLHYEAVLELSSFHRLTLHIGASNKIELPSPAAPSAPTAPDGIVPEPHATAPALGSRSTEEIRAHTDSNPSNSAIQPAGAFDTSTTKGLPASFEIIWETGSTVPEPYALYYLYTAIEHSGPAANTSSVGGSHNFTILWEPSGGKHNVYAVLSSSNTATNPVPSGIVPPSTLVVPQGTHSPSGCSSTPPEPKEFYTCIDGFWTSNSSITQPVLIVGASTNVIISGNHWYCPTQRSIVLHHR